MHSSVIHPIFSNLTGNGRVWIFTANRKLNPEEQLYVQAKFDVFCRDWSAHGSMLKAQFEILFDQLLVLGADEDVEPASGCAIDRSTAIFQAIEQELHLDLFNRLNLFFKNGEEWIMIPMHQLMDAYQKKLISDSTIFFDNSINSLHDFRTRWEVPLSESWLATKIKS